MSEILREKQKAEALKRMRLMGLREDFIRDFEEDGKVHICTFLHLPEDLPRAQRGGHGDGPAV